MKVLIVIGLSFCPITDRPMTSPDYIIGSQLVENTWSFKPITLEETEIFMIKIGIITQRLI